MIERVQLLITFNKGSMFKKGHIKVTLPEECTKAMQRDSVDPKPPTKSQGEKSWWLQQMLGMIPPTFWSQQWDATPEDLVQAANKSEWKEALQAAWTQAILRHPDAPWAGVWLKAYPGVADELIRVLPPEDGTARILHVVEGSLQRAVSLLQHYAHPWSIELSRAVVQKIRENLVVKQENHTIFSQIQQLFHTLPYRIAPALAEEVAATWQKTEGENWIMLHPLSGDQRV
jgi:hypothetical protein